MTTPTRGPFLYVNRRTPSREHTKLLRERFGVEPTRVCSVSFLGREPVLWRSRDFSRVVSRTQKPDIDGPVLRRRLVELARTTEAPGARTLLAALHHAEQTDHLPTELMDLALAIHANAQDALVPPPPGETFVACAERLAAAVLRDSLTPTQVLQDLYRRVPLAFTFAHHLARLHGEKRLRHFDLPLIEEGLKNGAGSACKAALVRVIEVSHRQNHAEDSPEALEVWSRDAWTIWQGRHRIDAGDFFREALAFKDPDILRTLCQAMADRATNPRVKKLLLSFLAQPDGRFAQAALDFLPDLQKQTRWLAKEKCRTVEDLATVLIERLESQPTRWAAGFREALRNPSALATQRASANGVANGARIHGALNEVDGFQEFFTQAADQLLRAAEFTAHDPWEVETRLLLYLGHLWSDAAAEATPADVAHRLTQGRQLAEIVEETVERIRHAEGRLAVTRPSSWGAILPQITPASEAGEPKERVRLRRYLGALWRSRPNAFARVFERDLFERILAIPDKPASEPLEPFDLASYLAPLRQGDLAREFWKRFEEIRLEQVGRQKQEGLAFLSESQLNTLAREVVAFYSAHPTVEAGMLIAGDGTDRFSAYGLRYGLLHAVDLFCRNPLELAQLRDALREHGLEPLANSHSQLLAGPEGSSTDLSSIRLDGHPELIVSLSEGKAAVYGHSGEEIPNHPLAKRISELFAE